MVAETCGRLSVPHVILTARWAEPPVSAVQERARDERYALLSEWLDRQGLAALATAHHADDQAETLMMRLNRGAGVRGLAAMRATSTIPGGNRPLLRPLLAWRRSQLEALCNAAGLGPADDPSNCDDQFERIRVRQGLAAAKWLDSGGIARSASNLGAADEAIDWAASQEWQARVQQTGDEILYSPATAPVEIRRRILSRALALLAREGRDDSLRGHEIDRLDATLSGGGSATLRGVLCSGGVTWRFTHAPRRRRPA